MKTPAGLATEPRARHDTLVIIGASITGLLVAKSLAPYFRRVVVLERDGEPKGPEARKGIPQGLHSHVLLVKGRRIFERIFPGLMEDLVSRGGIRFDYSGDGVLRLGGNRLPRFASGIVTVSCTRALLEWRVREKLKTASNVALEYGVTVNGLHLAPDENLVDGVYVAESGQEAGSGSRFLKSDLVVDASGRSSRLPAWLGKIGAAPPAESVVDPLVGYSSRLYEWPEAFEPGWKVVGMAANFPDNRKGGAILKLEGGRMMVTLVGLAGDYPPSDEDGFLEFAKSLPDPLLYETISVLRPLSQVKSYRQTTNRIRHYERLRGFPGGLAAVGDSVCALNPIYAQGLTLAAMGAESLLAMTEAAGTRNGFTAGFCRRFQKNLSRLNRAPWMMAVGEDIRWPATKGARPRLFNKLIYAYMGRLIRTMALDPDVTRRFLRVMHLVSHPASLFHPAVLLSILRHGITGKRLRSPIPETPDRSSMQSPVSQELFP